MLLDPQDRLGCRLQGVSAAWLVSPSQETRKLPREWALVLPVTSSLMHEITEKHWDCRMAWRFCLHQWFLRLICFWIYSNPLHLAQLQKWKSWNSIGVNHSLLFMLWLWLLGLNSLFYPNPHSGSLYPVYRICCIWASSLPFSRSAHGPFLPLLPALVWG